MGEKPKRKNEPSPPGVSVNIPPACPVCGHEEFTWGSAFGYGASTVYFRPRDTGILGRLFSNMNTSARMCNNCGNVLLFAHQWE